jgi:hypothetical protein
VPRLTLFDYGIFVFGAIGALLFVGRFGSVPPPVLFFWGLFSISICLLSLVALVGNLFLKLSRVSEWRIHVFYLCFNIIPGISFLVWQAGKTQIPTPPGCC